MGVIMRLCSDFNCRLDATDSLYEFLVNWNHHCDNDKKEEKNEFQQDKSVIDLLFVSKKLLEHFKQIKINNSFLTKHKQIFLML